MSFAVIDVAIGLALVFLLLAMFCSAVVELISGYLNLRGEMLWRGIEAMLGGKGAGGGFVERVLTLGHAAAGNLVPTPKALLSTAQSETLQQHREELLARNISKLMLESPLIESVRSGSRAPSYLLPARFASAFIDTITRAQGARPGAALTPEAVASLPDGLLRSQLEILVAKSRGDPQLMQQGLEQWFGETMERVTGWYKRQTQWLLMALGLIVAIAMNVDTIEIAQRLWHEPPMRAIAVSAAEKFATKYAASAPENRMTEARKALDEAKVLKLPIGWPAPWSAKWSGGSWAGLGLAAVGWMLTALAVSFGAPYWYDLLMRLLPLRSSGGKPLAPPESINAAPAATSVMSQPTAAAPLGLTAPSMPFLSALNEYEATSLSDDDIAEIRTALGLSGDASNLDQPAREAIRKFQEAQSITPNGELNADLVRRLIEEHRERLR